MLKKIKNKKIRIVVIEETIARNPNASDLCGECGGCDTNDGCTES